MRAWAILSPSSTKTSRIAFTGAPRPASTRPPAARASFLQCPPRVLEVRPDRSAAPARHLEDLAQAAALEHGGTAADGLHDVEFVGDDDDRRAEFIAGVLQ